jgi:hypothetical protein
MTNLSTGKRRCFAAVVDDNFRDALRLGDPFVSTSTVLGAPDVR